jgi:hypothetical protein
MGMGYRDDIGALEARIAHLGGRLSEVRKRVDDLAGAHADAIRIEAELDECVQALHDLRGSDCDGGPLADIRVAAPCPADWDKMTGDERVRFCGGCQKNVYNLSAMTAAEAETLVREREGKLCVRFYRRSDGTMLTDDCAVGVRRRRRRRAAGGLIAAAALVAGMRTRMGATTGMLIAPQHAPTSAVATSTCKLPKQAVRGAPTATMGRIAVMGKPMAPAHAKLPTPTPEPKVRDAHVYQGEMAPLGDDE